MQAESWAFAVDLEALNLLMGTDIFRIRGCKVCRGVEGIVVGSEYGLSKVLFRAGYNLATLMSRYAALTTSSGSGGHGEMLCAVSV